MTNPIISSSINSQPKVNSLLKATILSALIASNFSHTLLAANQKPTVTAGTDQQVTSKNKVELIAVSEDNDGHIIGHKWRQKSGPTVRLLNRTSANASFIAPEVASGQAPIELEFTAQTMDNQGASARDTVLIKVLPANNGDKTVATIASPLQVKTLNATSDSAVKKTTATPNKVDKAIVSEKITDKPVTQSVTKVAAKKQVEKAAVVVPKKKPQPKKVKPVVIPNSAPLLSGVAKSQLKTGENFDFTPISSDADSDLLLFAIANKPAWAEFSTKTGQLTGTPSEADIGISQSIRISVSDGDAIAQLEPFDINVVSSVNHPPVISGYYPLSATAETAYDYTPSVKDANNDSLIYSIENKPEWAEFDSSNGRLFGTPTNKDEGMHSDIRISVSDGEHSASFTLFAIGVENAPVIKE